MADLSNQIETDASRPKIIQGEGITVERHSLKDQIEADKYLAAKAATADMQATVKSIFSRVVPPGGF